MSLTYKRILVMLAVDILGERDQSYGNNIRNLIINTTGRYQTMYGGIYVYLHSLEELGYIEAWIGELAPRKFYTITKRGLKVLNEHLAEIEAFTKTSRAILRKRGEKCNPVIRMEILSRIRPRSMPKSSKSSSPNPKSTTSRSSASRSGTSSGSKSTSTSLPN